MNATRQPWDQTGNSLGSFWSRACINKTLHRSATQVKNKVLTSPTMPKSSRSFSFPLPPALGTTVEETQVNNIVKPVEKTNTILGKFSFKRPAGVRFVLSNQKKALQLMGSPNIVTPA